MKIAIQVCLQNGWENNQPVIHEVFNEMAAVTLCEYISHQFGNTTVRLTYPADNVKITLDYISRLNGSYIQSTQPNFEYPKK